MYWRLILKYFGPNIKHIYEVENILSYMLSRFLSTKVGWDGPSTSRDRSCENDVFVTRSEQKLDGGFPLDISMVKQKQQK